MKESRIKFIKEAYNEATQDWKVRIENEFTNIDFNTKLEVGCWYKYTDSENHLLCLTKIEKTEVSAYGFGGFSDWNDNSNGWDKAQLTKATDKEVEEALINEAKKRGFKEGVLANCLCSGGDELHNDVEIDKSAFKFDPVDNSLDINYGSFRIFCKGKWATIIEQPTKLTVEQVEEKLGFKVEIIS